MQDKYAIVAEYRGVALLEKAGDVRSVWNGKEYFTDGRTYVFFKSDDAEFMGLWSFDSERVAKAFIECYRDTPEELPADYQRPLLNYKQMYEVLHRKPYEGEPPIYAFNEEIGAFTLIDGIRDGQHRHKGIK